MTDLSVKIGALTLANPVMPASGTFAEGLCQAIDLNRIGALVTPMPRFEFPGLVPGDRWCVTAANWLRAHHDGAAAHVVLASTHERALQIVPLAVLKEHAVDVPAHPGGLED